MSDVVRFDATKSSVEDIETMENEVDDMFEYHAWDAVKVERGGFVRVALAEVVKVILIHVPPSADRSAAIRKLREARMDCNSAITHGGKY